MGRKTSRHTAMKSLSCSATTSPTATADRQRNQALRGGGYSQSTVGTSPYNVRNDLREEEDDGRRARGRDDALGGGREVRSGGREPAGTDRGTHLEVLEEGDHVADDERAHEDDRRDEEVPLGLEESSRVSQSKTEQASTEPGGGQEGAQHVPAALSTSARAPCSG